MDNINSDFNTAKRAREIAERAVGELPAKAIAEALRRIEKAAELGNFFVHVHECLSGGNVVANHLVSLGYIVKDYQIGGCTTLEIEW